MKGCNGRTDLRILRGEHNHTGIQPLQLFPEKEDYTTGKTERHPLGEKQANDWSGLPIWQRNIQLPIYSPKRLGHMGKQQTAGQIKGEWHSRRKEVVSMWPKLRKQTGYASLLCLPHSWISHNHGACEWLWEILKRGQSLRWKGGWETCDFLQNNK